MRFSGFVPRRPLTHDLLISVIDSLDANLDSIIIDDLSDNTFHAKLIIKDNKGNINKVDARPSDSIALAVRKNSPVFVSQDVLEKSTFLEK